MSLTGFNHNLHWSEFQIVNQRPSGAVRDAQVSVSTHINWRTAVQPSGDCQVVSVNASLAVDLNNSWVVNGKKGVYLRHHEQGHYDIVAIGLREMYNKIAALIKTRCEEVNQEALRIQREVQQVMDAALQRYLTQTNCGGNLSIQKNWETQIKTVKLNSSGLLADLPK
jgi:hypothetical protein